MVYWKSNRSAERLLSAIFAAHPNLKLDTQSIAGYFGEGATHQAVEKRIRFHRKEGEKMQTEANPVEPSPAAQCTVPTPRTPRSGSNRGAAEMSSSRRGKRRHYPSLSVSDAGEEGTPSKKPKLVLKFENTGSSLLDPISLVGSDGSTSDSDSDSDTAIECVTPVKKVERAHVVRTGLGFKREKGRVPAPIFIPPAYEQSPYEGPSLPEILSQPRVDSQSCAYTDKPVGAWTDIDRERAANVERAKAYYASCEEWAYVI